MTDLEKCIMNYSYCEVDNMTEQELVRLFDKMKMGGMIRDFRFTYLGQSRDDDTITIYELLHVRRNNGVVDVYSVMIRYRDGDVTRVRVERLFSI